MTSNTPSHANQCRERLAELEAEESAVDLTPSPELDGGEWFVVLMRRRVGLERDASLSANPVPLA